MTHTLRSWRALLAFTALALSASLAPAQTIRPGPTPAYHPAPFVHPGLLHTAADLARMKQMVGAGTEPWKSGFAKLAADPESSATWTPHPFEHVERSLLTGHTHGINEMNKDCNAAYQNALMWWITGDESHAKEAVAILNAWSGTLKVFDGTDVELGAGIDGFKFANAAELMRAYPGWAPADIARCRQMLLTIFYPPLQNFALWAHGNWDLACMKSIIAIGVFCDDHAMFDRAVNYYYKGQGNGALTHYVINEAGQVQESGRDQQHTQLGVGELAETCQVAWSQGLDLYGASDNRLLKGFEYAARYNLGQDVPFVPHVDTSGRFPADHISPNLRNRLRPIFEMAYNHYAILKGLPAPWTQKAAETLRPEGPAAGADHPGFGTLLFSLQPTPAASPTPPASPAPK